MGWLFLVVVGALAFFYVVGRATTPGSKMQDDAPESGEMIPVSANLKIRYQDAKQGRSERRIKVNRFYDVRELGLLKAYCYMRSDDRTFRVDRILSCVDTDTGEVVTDVRKHLQAKLERKISPAPRTPKPARQARPAPSPGKTVAQQIIDDHPDLVRVLMFVAMEDGRVSRPKQQLIAAYLKRVLGDDRITDGAVAMLAAGQKKPTLTSFKQSVGRLVNGQDINPVLVAGCCRFLAEEDGVITQDEKDALDYLDRRVMDRPRE